MSCKAGSRFSFFLMEMFQHHFLNKALIYLLSYSVNCVKNHLIVYGLSYLWTLNSIICIILYLLIWVEEFTFILTLGV